MAVGIYRDLAVGADRAGAETWADAAAVVSDAQVGAPPDIHNPAGQDWGLPPFHPRALRAERYQAFIELVRANMRHAGGLRIDHVMGLQHLYWVPQGQKPSAGAYVRYPIEDLVGILALESHRHQCLVVGEDLGTVPVGFRERMAEANILSYRVLYFEQEPKTSAFLPPSAYPTPAVAVIGSHDLPTLRGWWEGRDLDLKERLGLFPQPGEAARQRQARERDQTAAAARAPPRGIAAGRRRRARHPDLGARGARLSGAHPVAVGDGADRRPDRRGRPGERPGDLGRAPELAPPAVADLGGIGGPPALPRHRRDFPVGARKSTTRTKRPGMSETAPTPVPRATYRLQFHKGFGFKDAAALAPYLASLGISHVYASPYLKARPGSTHGYDIVDHGRLNPELGDETAFRAMVAAFRGNGLGQVLDFVPNHMGVGGSDNPWWLDVLEWGPIFRIRGLVRHRLGPGPALSARQAVGPLSWRPIRSGAGSGPARAALRRADRRVCGMGLRHPQVADLPAALRPRARRRPPGAGASG